MKLGTQAGRFGPGSETARAAHDQAAQWQELARAGAWTTGEDNAVPRKVANTRISGYTEGYS